MVTVTTASGPQQVAGTGWDLHDDGALSVTDDQGNDVAAFAAGAWVSVEVAPS